MPNELTKNELDAQSAYSNWHRAVHECEAASAEWQLADWHTNALELLPSLEGQAVLEVGCGRGQFSAHLAQNGAIVSALDFSEEAIGIAREENFPRAEKLKYVVGDAMKLPYEDNQFDIVVSCECLEHVTHPSQMIAECARVVKANGLFVLTTENYSNAMILAWIMAWIRGEQFNSGSIVQPIEHFFVFWRISKLLKRAGFRVERMVGSHHVFLLLPRVDPSTFVVERFHSSWARDLFRPFARHMAFKAVKHTIP